MGQIAVRTLGTASSALFRLASYLYLRWIPGRFGPIAIPIMFLASLLTQALNVKYTTRAPEISPAEAALVPDTIDAPSYAQVTAVDEPAHPTGAKLDAQGHIMADTTPNKNNNGGSVRRRRKKSGNSPGSSDESSAALTRRKLEEAHPHPHATTSLRQMLSSLVVGAPSPSAFLNGTAVLVNLLLLAAVVDSVWSPILSMNETGLNFVRVGAIDHHSVKIIARIPPTESYLSSAPINSAVNGTIATYDDEVQPLEAYPGAKLVFRPTKPLGKWISGTELHVKDDKDWTGAVKLDGLWASTEYEFRLLRASLTAAHHPAFPKSYFFTTAPDPALTSAASPGAGTHYTFASTSCVKPGFPYSGPGSKRTTKGAEYLKNVGEKLGLRFVMFLGDFIYSDVPYWPGAKLSSYHKRYRQTFASPEVHALAESLPIMTIYDDHEIYNDFDGTESDPAFASASQAYKDYLGVVNPDTVEPDVAYYEYRYGDSAFFVWDTRAYRSPDYSEDNESKTMLGEKQKQAFFDWVAKVNNTVTWKFIASSVPLTSLWSHGDDTWAGFTSERDEILDVLQYVPNVIVLSGDRHEFAATSIRTTVTEFSTSPLSMFYLPIRTLSQSHGRGATGEDVLLQYLPDGNSKFSTFEVDTRIANEPVVRVKVWIDGEEAWKVEVRGKPIEVPKPPSAIGGLGKSLMELLGFKKRSWF